MERNGCLTYFNAHTVRLPSAVRSSCAALLVSLLLALSAPAQTKDTLALPPDSLTLRTDSLAAMQDSLVAEEEGIDSVVTYTAQDSIVFTFESKGMKIYGKGDIRFKDLSLKSERIDVNWNTNQLESYGVLDSVKAQRTDSLKQRYTGTPEMHEGPDTYKGWKISYNFKSQKGRVTLGETAEDQGYYQGQQIKKMDKEMLFISDGYYSTCEYGHPHFYFFSPAMRVTVRDKIVARPIYLYIADVPIFALPFGVFPSQGGRRSGIIAPAFVDKGARGTGLEHFGYYFAINDYMDASIVGDWLTGGTWRASPNVRYAKRYDLSGSLSGYYQHTYENEPLDANYLDQVDYVANIMHDQTFNPTTRMSVNFSFASSESYKRALTQNEFLNQEITSNATLSKSWEGTSNSMSININRRQDLITGSVTNALPSISFSHSQSYPFRFGKSSSGSSDYAWYEMISMGYNSNYQRVDNRSRSVDTIPYTYYNRQGISHNVSLTAAPKAGYFTVSPYFNYNERWYDKSLEFKGLDTNGAVISADRNGFEAIRTFGVGVGVSTKLYGMLQPPVPGIAGIRHTVTPSISYNYNPDFSEAQYGYYTQYKDKLGREQKFNRFSNEIFGGASAQEQQSVSLNVGNLFEMKTAPSDTAQKPSKIQLMNVGLGTSYNFAADSFQLAPLNIFYRTDIGQYLGINASTTYSFYEYDQRIKQRVSKYLYEDGKGIAQLTNVSLSLTTSLSGEKRSAETQQDVNDSTRIAERQKNLNASGYKGIYDNPEPDFSIPWSLALSFNFSQSQDNPNVKTRSANISGSIDFNLTENWKFTASSGYDLVSKQLAAPQFNISRDLHCWLMNFSWNPLGTYAGYRFEIKVKAPQLQDIKVTKQNSDRL